MSLSELMAELEAAKAKLAVHRLREEAIRREIEEMEAKERWNAYRLLADAAFAAVCKNPTGANAYDVLQRACQNCSDPERRYLRARILVETIHEQGRAQLASLFGADAAEADEGPEPLLGLSLEEEAALWMPRE